MANIRYYIEFKTEEKAEAVRAGETVMEDAEWDSRTSISVIAHVDTIYYAEIGTGYIGKSVQVDDDYLDRFCIEVDEEIARQRHPELFMFLYQNNILKGDRHATTD